MNVSIRKLNDKSNAAVDTAAKAAADAASAKDAALAASGGPQFVHLKVHSAYSLLEGALPIGKLAKLTDKLGFPAVGLTDTSNMFGALEFSDKLAASGIQPIVGITLQVDFRDTKVDTQLVRLGQASAPVKPAGAIALLAMNDDGYANLMKLTSLAFMKTPDAEETHIKIEALQEFSAGLIVLTGGPDGPLDTAIANGQRDLAEARLKMLAATFGDRLYVELQRHGSASNGGGGTASEAQVEPVLLDFAYGHNLPLVATNEVYFTGPEDYEAHDALLCIAKGNYVIEENRRRLTPEHGFKSAAAMCALFADLPEALVNTVEIAKRCAFRPRGKKPILPNFVATKEGTSAEEQLAAEAGEMKRQAEEGLKVRLAKHGLAPGFTTEDYEKRLAFELQVITGMKFPGYFLIVADFIKWSKEQGIPVGPGRGSGAGSVVAWALTITDLDPLRFGLLFERFLNPERVSMPDFDIDFCQDRREETILYVQKKYGADRVAQIITHGKLQARAVLRDVGRVLQMPFGQVSRLCNLVPNNPANPTTLPEAIEIEPKLQEERDNDPAVAKLLEIAQKLEGLYRHASTHAAGLVIGDRPLDQLVPLYRDPKSNFAVTQFNMKLVETAGLVKFDFLGLKTLTVLQKCVALIKRGRGVEVDLMALPLDDKPAYDLLAKADTVGVFQLESTGMRESLKKLKPDMFEDIIAMVSLYRPGPMDNIPTYIARKHKEEEPDYLHPMLEGILKETYGVIIYQEQVIQIAQVMGGYTLGQADLLRRAMGKKDKDEMARQKAKFIEGAAGNKVSAKDANYIFELVDKFAGYGFNKSHAAAYALISYHTAYLKANFREEFLAASMSLDMANTDKLAMFASEARREGIEVRPPCVNSSFVDFGVDFDSGKGPAINLPGAKLGAIRYSLSACKNIGVSAVQSLVDEREANGRYKDLGDFARRMNAKALNKRGLETLAAGGAFDAFDSNRARVHGNVDQIMALAARTTSDAEAGTTDLFAMGGGGGDPPIDLRPVKNWTPSEKLDQEFGAVGFYLSGHPLDEYEAALASLGAKNYAEFEAGTERGQMHGRLGGIVVSARERRSAKGNKFAFALFSDQTRQFEAVIFSDTLDACGELLTPGQVVLISVEAERDGDTVKCRVQGLEALDKAAANIQQSLKFVLDPRAIADQPDRLSELRSQLKPGGKSEVRFVLRLPDMASGGTEVDLWFPKMKFDISPSQKGLLSAAPGVLAVEEM
jgi:DNA polymerase III subunit alpha